MTVKNKKLAKEMGEDVSSSSESDSEEEESPKKKPKTEKTKSKSGGSSSKPDCNELSQKIRQTLMSMANGANVAQQQQQKDADEQVIT